MKIFKFNQQPTAMNNFLDSLKIFIWGASPAGERINLRILFNSTDDFHSLFSIQAERVLKSLIHDVILVTLFRTDLIPFYINAI